ncbi:MULTISPECIES: CopD family protein [unclassified Oleiphilus]|jgi:uncharacterized membrane protein|uniref:CopD family protein n=2 Tax=Oleiphilus TaxID=141450 RepID=UPI0007C2C662|nr:MULTISPECIES: CopD family protein [unclassified Oleiphilus]KZY45916.1 hypothetical protein A3732_08945 [Oleiphilus sp. HI0050]KZY77532.1 hypothetical protein A3740_10255 [Oleiphilus sp. HI0068]KZY79757.1 hypothetical protein A3741_19815 [Oleiphilus sp. HI0069]KZY89344.1 hypothetical protein A3743_08710 [Oleiphilus sp. HI0072]KZZ07512.1 hypothetical protein A3749_02200 [Oleiphilus sp. HI0078]KZZ18551.1 hypothetical protein A3752_16780 [Oleiphilus sp. HI0081]KZZ47267.1 hypothetical protein 
MAIALTLHILAATIWVGGMFFAYLCLRPVAASLLEPPLRLSLWQDTFKRFFFWVWIAVAVLLVSGHGMIALYGGFASIGKHVHMMLGLGYIMFLLFGHLYFVPFKRMKAAVSENRWPDAATHLNLIRKIVAINLTLGLIVIAIASGGKFLFSA